MLEDRDINQPVYRSFLGLGRGSSVGRLLSKCKALSSPQHCQKNFKKQHP
jgi:hypothetical protein